MGEGRRRAVAVALSTKWLSVIAGVAAPFVTSGAQRVVLLVVALVGGAFRADDRYPWLSLAGSVAVASAAVSAAAADGGPDSLAYGALIFVAIDIAVQRGGGLGAVVGGLGAGAVALLLWLDPGSSGLDGSGLFTLALTPLAALAFGTVHRDLPITGVVAMRATTQALDELVALSQRVRPGLDRWGVAEAVVQGLREDTLVDGETTGTEGPHLLIAVDGVLHGVGAPWHRQPLGLEGDLPTTRRTQPFRAIAADHLPPAVAASVTQEKWLVHRLDSTSGGGAVLVDARTHPVVLERLIDTISTATIALANSARFQELQSIATDAARSRLAADLHDGIAQALTHARFELDLAAMAREDEELDRARHAADAALAEVRRTIGELRDLVPLSDALRQHVDTVRSFARVPVELTIEGSNEPNQAVGDDVLRLAQEALSNALRHSSCSRVEISLHLDNDGMLLSVIDDGSGIGPDITQGVGLRAMRERADAIGGDLFIGPSPSGGTMVELEVRPGSWSGPWAQEPAVAGRGAGGWRRTRKRRGGTDG